MHDIRETLLEKQAESLGIELLKILIPETALNGQYEKIMLAQMHKLKSNGIDIAIFGDIFLEDLRKYREDNLQKQNFKVVLKKKKKDTHELVLEFVSLGFKAIVTCIDGSKLSKDFVDREIDENFINDLPKNVDPCGENGEYHSFVFDGPIFKNKIVFEINTITEKVIIDNNNEKIPYYYCDII
jgi:uncharacterized protein (TIGR00290 family)